MTSGKQDKRDARLAQLKNVQAKLAPHVERLPDYAQRGKETLQRFFPPEKPSQKSPSDLAPADLAPGLGLPSIAEVRARWSDWKQPAAKLARQKRRASRTLLFSIIVAILFGLYGFLAGVGVGESSVDVNDLVIGIAGFLAFGALSVRSGLKLRQVNRQLGSVRLAGGERKTTSFSSRSLPTRGSAVRLPMERLIKAEASFVEVSQQLAQLSVGESLIANAESVAKQTASALRELADRIQAVERARDTAGNRDRAGLNSAIKILTAQFEEGLEGYQSLVAAAAHTLVAVSNQDAVAQLALTEATEHLAGLATALRELG